LAAVDPVGGTGTEGPRAHEDLRDRELRTVAERLAQVERDAKRYRRLQILGCAPYGSQRLAQGTVLRFTGLDAFVDDDLRRHASRGEAFGVDGGSAESPELTTPANPKELAEKLATAEASLAKYRAAFALCEVHTPDLWEGDGTCVICEAVEQSDKLKAAEASLAQVQQALRQLVKDWRTMAAAGQTDMVPGDETGAIARWTMAELNADELEAALAAAPGTTKIHE
jgi:hypothetical protein